MGLGDHPTRVGDDRRGSPPRVREHAQVVQRLVELVQPALADVLGPLRQDPSDLGIGDAYDAMGPRRQVDEPRPSVGGVGGSLDVAGRLELLDEEGSALLGDPGLLGQVGAADRGITTGGSLRPAVALST